MAISPENLKALVDFAKVAEEYVRLIDGLRQGRTAGFYKNLESLLLNLHQAILPVEKEKSSEREHPEFKNLAMTHEQWKEVAQTIAEAVHAQTDDLFQWHEGDKPDANEVTLFYAYRTGMLWDDLTDIYRDLQDGLALWRLNTPDSQAEAAWEWRLNFEIHWGEHLFWAMSIVHEILYQLFAT